MQKNLQQQLKTLLKSSCLLLCLFLAACTSGTAFEKTFEEVGELDAKNSVNLSDYDKGLTNFDFFAREGVSINDPELAEFIEEIEVYRLGVKDDEALAYVDFRLDLFKAERYFKQASRKPFSGYDSIIKCRTNSEEVHDSIRTVRNATSYLNNAINVYNENKWEFMYGNWARIASDDMKVINDIADSRESIIVNECPKFMNATAVNLSLSE